MILLIFACLQFLDAATTWLFLRAGVAEANPLIRAALAGALGHAAGSAATLVLVKILALAMGTFAWYTGRRRLVLAMNCMFTLCVAWNLAAICTSCL